MDLSSRCLLLTCLFVTYQAAFSSYQSSSLVGSSTGLQSELSSSDRIQAEVISSESLYIGIDNHIIVRVSRRVENITVRITPSRTQQEVESCQTLYQEMVQGSIAQGRDHLLKFYLPASSHFVNTVNHVHLSLLTHSTELYQKNYMARYPKVTMVLEKEQYTLSETARVWLYSYDGNHLPLADTNLTVAIKVRGNVPISQANITTDKFGLGKAEFSLPNILQSLSTSQYRDGLTITAQHIHTMDIVATKQFSIIHKKPRLRQLEIDLTTSGYFRQLGVVTVTVTVRRPGAPSFNGKFRLEYCQSDSHCKTIKHKTIDGLDRSIPLLINHSLADLTEKLNITATIIERSTGVVEKVQQTLDLFPHRLSFLTYNLPAVYTPGQSLHLPLMVLQNDEPAVYRQLSITLSNSQGVVLHTSRVTTTWKGEKMIDWMVPADVSGNLTLRVTDTAREQPVELNHMISSTSSAPPTLQTPPTLQSTSYRYNIGEEFQLSLSTNTLLATGQKIVVSQCGGGILTVLYSLTDNQTITADMYPCVSLQLIQTGSTHPISTVTFLINAPDEYELTLPSQTAHFLPGEEAELQTISSLHLNQSHRAFTDSSILLYTTNSLSAESSDVLLQLIPQSKYEPTSVITDLQSNSSNSCIERQSSISGKKLNRVVVIPTRTSQTGNTIGRRPSLYQESPLLNDDPLITSAREMILSSTRPKHQEEISDTSTQYSQIAISPANRQTTTTVTPQSSITSPRLSWLTPDPFLQQAGFPDRWFTDGVFSNRLKREVTPSNCSSANTTSLPVAITSHRLVQIKRCSEEEPIRITVPTSSPADWLVCGLLASPRYGLQGVTSTRVKTRTDAHLTLKSPPTDLTEGEQFQIHLAVRSTLPTPLEAHVRLILSAEEAFCFKNLILNSYPHVNLTLTSDSNNSTSFTATALRRGNFSVQVELWIRERRVAVESLQLQVSAARRQRIRHPMRNTTPLVSPSSNSGDPSGNLHLKMRYNKNDNQNRCKGFRLKVDHSVLEANTDTTRSPYEDHNYWLSRKKRALVSSGVDNTPRHSLRVCYRILQKSARGSYYIDVESFTGYRTVDNFVESEGDNCKIQNSDVLSYNKGKIIMVENSVSNHSWCCFSLVLESTNTSPDQVHTQMNQSASVRMHDSDSPGDFCLEFYNLKSETPYSDHICSQHGCLCTEGTMNACKQMRKQSTRRATQSLTKMYLESRYAFKVRIVAAEGQMENSSHAAKAAVIEAVYGETRVEKGQQRIHIYYKESRRSCDILHINSSYIILGRQVHVEHNRVISLYLDHQSSVISMDELATRGDFFHIECFLNSLLCPSLSMIESANDTRPDAAELSSTINSNCKMQRRIQNWNGIVAADKAALADNQCYSNFSQIYRKHEIYQSIKANRRRNKRGQK